MAMSQASAVRLLALSAANAAKSARSNEVITQRTIEMIVFIFV